MRGLVLVTKAIHKFRELRTAWLRALAYLSASFEGRPWDNFTNEESIRRRKIFCHYLYNFIFSFLIALTLTQRGETLNPQIFSLRPGDIAEQDIIAPITADLEPKGIAKLHQEELEKNVPPVFDYDDLAIETWLRRWELAFRRIREEFYAGRVKKIVGVPDGLNQRLTGITGQILSPNELSFLHQYRFSAAVEHEFLEMSQHLLGRLIAPSNLFPLYYNTGIQVRLLNQSLRETLIHDVSRVWSVEQAREYIDQLAAIPHIAVPGEPPTLAMSELVKATIIPNLRYNQAVTQKRVSSAISSARSVPLSVKRGQILVQRGERISDLQASVMQNLQELTSKSASTKRFFLSLLLLFVFFSVLFRLNITGRAFWNLSLKDAVVFMAITLLAFLCVKFALPYLRRVFAPLNMGFGVEYLLPISAGGIIIHLMMGKETAFTYATLISIVIGYLLDQNFYFTVYSFAVTASAIQSIRACKQRTDLYRCGAWSGLIGALLVLSFSLTQTMGYRSIDWFAMTFTVGLAFLSGILAAIITSTLIPVFESVFGYTTSLKLLELSNFNHPLLHSLMLKAPGTYHHSVLVGSLAELAADRIKANSLLARVSAYYHDIGKMNKPMYFIENQTPNTNPHDQLQPSMSAKILFAHVKDGVKLGREYNLGSNIVNIIEQHHGTTLVSYFYNKAKKVEKPELDPVCEDHFRYPGPRPQSREAAIVMLADACEAATRSIADPTAPKIQTMVHAIITKRFLEDQFAECDLTLGDLKIVEECFTRTLVSLYHHRIEYPGQSHTIERGNVAPAAVGMGKKG
jgi:cyclic-di-AMP phosphodiesterase PgpH